jgi:succinoglycan biosynthesis transport protein ExoP
VEHYLRLLYHRKWLVLSVFVVVSAATAAISRSLPDIFLSYTLILVDPQKVPETYVKSTVTGDVRNRLGTLSQQILSATRLQKIIETFNLYQEDRKKLAREDIISRMRRDIAVNVVSDFGGSQDLQAFRIAYSGKDPRLVAQVTNELASLFIEENLKAREQQATGTTEFLQNQLLEARKTLEVQESKLRDFKLKHIGEMPEQQTSNLQILGQLQSQFQVEADAVGRAEQQKSYIQSMMAQSAPVVDVDDPEQTPQNRPEVKDLAKPAVSSAKARLAALLARYSEKHPDVQKLKRQIAEEEAKAQETKESQATTVAASETKAAPAPPMKKAVPPVNYSNPVLQSQLKAIDAEIIKHKEEQKRLSRLISTYQVKLEKIPVREQEISDLVRDYEISKTHYSQLLNNQLSAETATQLEIRQKGEKFAILDPAQPAERPSKPNRQVINALGSIGGLILGVLLALATQVLGMSITTAEQLTATSGFPVLEVIPVIRTSADVVRRRRRMLFALASGVVTALACCAILLYHYRGQIF